MKTLFSLAFGLTGQTTRLASPCNSRQKEEGCTAPGREDISEGGGVRGRYIAGTTSEQRKKYRWY